MNLAEVVQVVGHASTHERGVVVFETLEQLDHTLGVVIEPGDTHAPRQPQPRSLRDEPADVWVRIARPVAEHRERPIRVLRDERADAALGAEALGEFVLRPHGELEVCESPLGDEQGVRLIEERGHADAEQLVRGMFGPERLQQHLDGLGVVLW